MDWCSSESIIVLLHSDFRNSKSWRSELQEFRFSEYSGKSNIYDAFGYMSDYVADSFKYGDEEERFEEFRPTPFLFDSVSVDAESSFEVFFSLLGDSSGRNYNYGFYIDKEGVTEEWLNAKAKSARKYSTVFYRGTSDEELDLSGFPKSSRDNI